MTALGRLAADRLERVIRTDAEYDFAFPRPCALPSDYPPRPVSGQMLVVAARAWNGCPACVRIACVRRADGGPLTVTVDSGGGGDCAAIGVAGAWASVPWSAAPVAFTPGRALDVPTECR